jgi:adenylate cyclase
LKESPDVAIADAYADASILFADMAGFTARASKMTAPELVQFLNGVYAQIDNLVERHCCRMTLSSRSEASSTCAAKDA